MNPIPHILPLPHGKDYEYLVNPPKAFSLGDSKNILIAQEIDAETRNKKWPDVYDQDTLLGRRGVTVQVKSCLSDQPKIFTHADQVAYLCSVGKHVRHPALQTGFAGTDYLRWLGFAAGLRQGDPDMIIDDYKAMRQARFSVLAYFATADVNMMFQREFLSDFQEYIDDRQVAMPRKRLISRQGRQNFLRMPWILDLEGEEYAVQLTIHDVGVIHGHGGLKEFYKTTGISYEDKDWARKTGYLFKMHEAYWEDQDNFDDYCVGDIKLYAALVTNAERFRTIYGSLGCQAYYHPPKLTIGSTVEAMFQATIRQLFDHDPGTSRKKVEKFLNKLCREATSDHLRQQIDSTAALLSKVEGGRCRSNDSTLTRLMGAIVDLDLAGCYADGLRVQSYPVGTPVVFDYPWPEDNPAYPTLRQLLDAVRWGTKHCELIPGLWIARMSCAPGHRLRFDQDFFASWCNFNRRAIRDEVYDQTILDENPTLELDVKTGYLKVFTNELYDASLTHDGLQWILNCTNPSQKDEFLDHVHIHACLFYPASERVESGQAVLDAQDTYTTKRTPSGLLKKTADQLGTCRYKQYKSHAWHAVNLGELLVDRLLAYRQMFKGKDEYDVAMNKLFKLVCNTLFGVLVSPFFETSNACVGANITARARLACWVSEKGFHGKQSITDGCQLDLNRTIQLINGRKVYAASLAGLYSVPDATKRHLRLQPLGNYTRHALRWEHQEVNDPEFRHDIPILVSTKANGRVVERKGKRAVLWLNKIGMPHLRTLFHGLDVLDQETTAISIGEIIDGVPTIKKIKRKGQYSFAMKRFYDSLTLHGSADYLLENPSFYDLKMRGYQTRDDTEYWAMRLEGDTLLLTDAYQRSNPGKRLLEGLRDHPTTIKPDVVSIFSAILKAKELQNGRSSRYARALVNIGDDIFRQRLVKEWSITQSTYRTRQQYEDILNERTRCINRFSWYVEPYFYNGSTVNYHLMIHTCDKLIREEKTLEPHKHFHPACVDPDCPQKNGRHSLLYALDPHDHYAQRHGSRQHPAHDTYMAVKERLRAMLKGKCVEEENEEE